MNFRARSATRRSPALGETIATTPSRSAANRADQAVPGTTLSKWILAAAIIGIGAAYLAVTSGVPRSAARFKERLDPGVVTVVPAGTQNGNAARDLRNVRPVSPEIPNARFRFGFLEFEDDPDATTK